MRDARTDFPARVTKYGYGRAAQKTGGKEMKDE